MILRDCTSNYFKNNLSQKSQTNTDYISLDIFHYADYVTLNRFTQIILFSIKF